MADILAVVLDLGRGIATVYLWIVILRAILQLSNSDANAALSKYIRLLTIYPLFWIKVVLIPVPARTRNVLAPAALIAIVAVIEQLFTPMPLHFPDLLVAAAARCVRVAGNIFIFVILIRVVMSWVRPSKPYWNHELVYSISETLLAPARRFIPTLGGLDFSPIVVLLVLNAVISMLTQFLFRLVL